MVKRKSSGNNDPFRLGNFGLTSSRRRDSGSGGINFLGSSSTNFLKPRTEKQRKRDQLRENQETGLRKQRFDEMMYQMQGYEVKRRRTGCDFEAKRTNFFTGKKEHLYVESKASSTAPVRPLQKQMQKKKKGNYRVERGGSLFF